jgi:hypothetical protein
MLVVCLILCVGAYLKGALGKKMIEKHRKKEFLFILPLAHYQGNLLRWLIQNTGKLYSSKWPKSVGLIIRNRLLTDSSKLTPTPTLSSVVYSPYVDIHIDYHISLSCSRIINSLWKLKEPDQFSFAAQSQACIILPCRGITSPYVHGQCYCL